jgi:hypothetical protein
MVKNRSGIIITEVFFCVWSLLVIVFCLRGLIKYIRHGRSIGIYSVFAIPLTALSLELIAAISKLTPSLLLTVQFAFFTSSIRF